jgi:hypothetical protein
MHNSAIYKIQSNINSGRSYIGSAVDVGRRRRPLPSETTKQKMRESQIKAWVLRRLKKQIINQEVSLCN